MMNHSDIRHKLSDYIDDAVSAVEKAEIDAHLKTCATCSDALEELRKMIEQVKSIEEIEPPAWMTGKIMAQVRAEAEQNKSIFQRFLRSLAYKLPMQTVAVLFLAVTAYYIYQNINPAGKYAETPMEIEAEKAAPEPARIAQQEKVIQAPAPRMKKAVQEPGFKSLDMKYAHEKAAQPVPMKDEAAPAPAPAAPAQAPAAGAATGAPASQMMRSMTPRAMSDEAEQPVGFAEGRKAKSPTTDYDRAKPARDDARKVSLALSVKDIGEAEKEIERIIRELKGAIVRREAHAASRVVTVTVDAKLMGQLREKIGQLGTLREGTPIAASSEGALLIEISLVASANQ